MAQTLYDNIVPSSDNGITLADDLNKFKDVFLTQNLGSVRPSYVLQGTIWLSNALLVSDNIIIGYFYDGSQDIEIYRIDVFNHAMSFSNAGKTIISTAQPAGVTDGQMWFNTSDATLYLRFNGTWVDPLRVYLKASDISLADVSLPFSANTLQEYLEAVVSAYYPQFAHVISNNSTTAIPNLYIDSEDYYHARVEIGIRRKDTAGEYISGGELRLKFRSASNTWIIEERFDSEFLELGLELSVATTEVSSGVFRGQVSYTANELDDATHEGVITWNFITKSKRS